MLAKRISAEDIASQTGHDVRYVKEKLSKTPDFPRAIKIGRNRFWFESEFEKWFMQQREC